MLLNRTMNRICLVIHSLSSGGMERVMSLLANNFVKKEGVEVHLVLIGISRTISYPLDDSVVVHRPGFTFENSRRTMDTFRTMMFIRSEVKSIDPHTVLSFGEMWNNMVLLSLYGTSYPVYISDRSQPDKNLGILHNFLRNLLYPTARGFIAQTERAGEICLEKGWNRNVKVIGNPVRNVVKEPGIEKENIVLTVGRLIKTKHIDHLIDIFAEIGHPDWKLVVVGGDAKHLSLSEKLQSKVDNMEMGDQILLEGQQKDVDRYFNRSKIFAFTSSSEGFPNVIGEALSAGLPVVAYDCMSGPAELVDDEVNGFLVPLFDKDQFKLRLEQLMNDKDLRQRFSMKSGSTIGKFTEDIICEKYFHFIRDEPAKDPETEVSASM